MTDCNKCCNNRGDHQQVNQREQKLKLMMRQRLRLKLNLMLMLKKLWHP